MNTNHILHYTRHILTLILVVYLILTWMYYKDNVTQLTSINLLISFIVIPLALFTAILTIKWQQKKIDLKQQQPEKKTAPIKETVQPKAYKIRMHSSLCLPEGENFFDIVENKSDLTILSEAHSDYNDLPLLIKPLSSISESLDTMYMQDLEPNNGTQRCCQLIQHLLELNDSELMACAQHFQSTTEQETHYSNAAISMHPEWQQSYISSTPHDGSDDITVQQQTLFTALPVYVCASAAVNTHDINHFIKAQLADYGFDEHSISIINLPSADVQTTPLEVIKQKIMTLSEDTMPGLSLVIAVDSEINTDWIEAHMYHTEDASALLPEEAGSLLILWNEAANAILDINAAAHYSMIEYAHDTTTNHRSNHTRTLARISDFIDATLLSLSAKADNSTSASNTAQSVKQTEADTDAPLASHSMTALSDINPVKQVFDTAVFMTFIDRFLDKGALVNDYQLGHHMHRNDWMRHLIGISLFADVSFDNQLESDIIFLTTQHDAGYTLWLAEPIITS